jgi:plastocyanin
VNDLKNITLLSIIFIIFSSFFLGCVKAPLSTPTPTATPTAMETSKPTAVPTTITLTPTPAPSIPSVYKAFVDEYYGFKRVIEISYKPIVYQNLTLNIHVGDTVNWVNDASEDQKLTIISEQNLWSNSSAIMRWNYQSFNYTFTQPGTYGVYIREYPGLHHQKIIVTP